MPSIIAVDVDDTVYGFCDLARKLLTEEGFETGDKQVIAAAYAPWPEWRSPVDLLGLDKWLEVIDRCHDDDMILSQRPYEGAVDTLCELSDTGHKLIYISNRATETKSATLQWLMSNCFPAGELIVTSEAKKPFVAHCQYMIDDRPKTIVEFRFDHDWAREHPDKPRKVFSLTKEFNRGLTDVPGVYLAPTWVGIRHYLQSKGLIGTQVPV